MTKDTRTDHEKTCEGLRMALEADRIMDEKAQKTKERTTLEEAIDDHALPEEHEYKKGFAAGTRWLRIQLENYFMDTEGKEASDIIERANFLIFGKE